MSVKLKEIKNGEFYVLVAPDGEPQFASLAEDFEMSIAFLQLLHSTGMGKSPSQMFEDGFTILPVKMSMKQNGDENTAFKKNFPK